MLPPGKRLVLLGARGDHGYDTGGRLAHLNHAEAMVRAVFAYIGLTEVYEVAVEADEFGGEKLARSLARAVQRIDSLVAQLAVPSAAVA